MINLNPCSHFFPLRLNKASEAVSKCNEAAAEALNLSTGDAQLRKQLHQALGIKPNQLQAMFKKHTRKQPPPPAGPPTKKTRTANPGVKGPLFCR